MSKPPPYPYCDAPHCFRHGMYDGKCPEHRIAELQTELASYMESDANLRKRVEELEALVANLSESLTGCNENNRKFAKEFRKHTALEDGVLEMIEDTKDTPIVSGKVVRLRLEALLGKESEE